MKQLEPSCKASGNGEFFSFQKATWQFLNKLNLGYHPAIQLLGMKGNENIATPRCVKEFFWYFLWFY